MNEISELILAGLGGILLGIIFFGGLWYTVNKIVKTKIPALWMLGSFILRSSVIVIGFYFIGAGDWRKLVTCILGFIISRFIVLKVTKSKDAKKVLLEKEVFNEA